MRSWLLLPIVVIALALSAPVRAQNTTEASTTKPKAAPQKRAPQAANGHVYLLRGLLNIFSLGMDDLAAKIQAKGISATVYNHSEWQGLADEIAAKYKARQHGPVVLVGHSLGADAVMYMAEYLGRKGVPVALVVPFDGTGSFAASSNVSQVMNLTQRDYAYMRRGSGFRGQLNNIDVTSYGVGHIDIDKSARLHAMVLSRIQTVIRTRGAPTATASESTPRPRSAPAQQQASPASEPAAAVPVPGPATEAVPAAPKPAPATTASTNASANASVTAERPVTAPPPVSRPATVSTESSSKRPPAGPDGSSRPALRF